MATITTLCDNVRLAARQTPARVRILRQPCGGLVGGGFEHFDAERSHHRLPTVTEFWLKVWTGIGQPTHSRAYYTRREMYPDEVRQLWRATSGAIRHTRKLHPELCV